MLHFLILANKLLKTRTLLVQLGEKLGGKIEN